jgi:asparagine synthase (glutamine-hydrolysing)
MTEQYLAVCWPDNPALEARARRDIAVAASAAGLVSAFAGDRFAVFATPTMTALEIDGGHGVVLGTLFRRNGVSRATERFGAKESDHIIRTGGQSLIDAYWGGYVAFVGEGRAGDAHVLCDPTGSVSCLHARRDGLTFVFSDPEVAADAGLIDVRIDWTFVAQHLAYPGLRAARTGLAGVGELLAGTRLSLGPAGEAAVRCGWSPWTFAGADRLRDNPLEAMERVGAEARRCVGVWASQSRSILLQLSGGLDSSIVAACLSQAQADVQCITLATPHPGADERAYAQRVADQIGAPLAVLMLDAGQGDVTSAWPTRLSRPGINVLQRCVDRVIAGEARRIGAASIFSGAGGDSVFCYLDTAAPAADVLRTRGPGAAFARSVGDLAALHQCTLWRAARLAVKKAYRAPPKSWRLDRQFLSDEACAVPAPDHPWFPGPTDALPGKREQVASIMGLQSISEGSEQSEQATVRHPLLSQPLVELCLSIPSWMWMVGGRNRAVARDAFAHALPPVILNRRTKGDFSGFSADIFDRQRGVLREQLLGGKLAAHGLLDRPAIERFLAEPIRPRDNSFFRLFLFSDMETWIGSWSDAPSSPAWRV